MLRASDTIQRTDTGRQRRGNEDCSYARAPLFVLADGMGGAAAGEVASQIAIEAFRAGLPAKGGSEERLAVVAQRANREIYDRARADPRLDGMGTTLTAVYLDADRRVLALAHVGDSRAYRLRDGELTRLTEDHSLVEELVKDGRLTEEEAFEHPQRSIITRALGQEPIVEVDTLSYPAGPDDVIMLCSDGLTDMLPERTVAELLAAAPDLDTAASRLIDAANEAGGRDNITVVLFRVEDVSAGAEPSEETLALGGAQAAAAGYRAGSAEGRPGGSAYVTPRPEALRDLARAGKARVSARLPLARTQGPPRAPQREFNWVGKLVAGAVTLAILLFLFGGGGYLASRQLYFLATDNQGTVVVDRGFPYRVLGVNMYETYYVSGVPASLIPADRRAALLNHELHSETAAFKLINDLELGKISG
ncbi:Stp1/IreP family PP2C-type Ser/Thr phosphatase [Conexibacter sp. DBS9H8]|uniref:Stp1/IreP family PP2C-type Ser/Thr phosphatase n=1 Tax=Conexibacter sp. DBS9H8 TaxID=2937801 RepID=UPI00200BC375|nr:Stp1/IreP family PP2C-type Ser/Thr phosphatase [Conexibacter sp. DBS9H8]